MDTDTRLNVKESIRRVMESILRRRTVDQPFTEAEIAVANPFGYRLAPVEVWKGSKFERSLVTSLGQGVFEQIARILAEGSGALAENQHSEVLSINTGQLDKIHSILREQRGNKGIPNWRNEVEEVTKIANGIETTVRVTSDLYIRRPTGIEEYYSFKTVKPNLDQTEVAKKDMLQLLASKRVCEVYFGLPFNPAGDGQVYRLAGHGVPYRLFEMDTDPCVLIGSALWNKVGNSSDSYDQLLKVFEEVGAEYSSRIRQEYFGISPQ